MKKILITTLVLSTMALANAGYSKCISCHGTTGDKKALGKSAVITGQEASKTIEQLTAYRAGTLNITGLGPIMQRQVSSMDDKTISAIAEYISQMK